MADVLFTNARIFDGSGAQPYTGDVLVQGNRIARVTRTGHGMRSLPVQGATVVDTGGAFLMPGMVEAHTHFSWNDQPSLDAIQRMPPEEHVLWCAQVAERYLDMGWTSCVGAAAAKPRLDVVIRNAIEDGTIVGPRYLAASQEITVPGVGLRAAAVEDARVGEKHVGHVVCSLYRWVARKSRSSRAQSSARSTGVQWPQRFSTTMRAERSRSAIARTDCGGATTSSSPVTSSTGTSMRSIAAGAASASASQLRA